jgi:hypothetical protein
LTTQGLGFTDEIPDHEVDAVGLLREPLLEAINPSLEPVAVEVSQAQLIVLAATGTCTNGRRAPSFRSPDSGSSSQLQPSPARGRLRS